MPPDRESPEPLRGVATSLAHVDDLLAAAGESGLCVRLRPAGARRPVPVVVDRIAASIVRESLANVLVHAGATTAAVAIRYEPGAVVVEVGDDGHGAPEDRAPLEAGGGLDEVARFAELIGGGLTARTLEGGGFRVRAWLPTEGHFG
jgi:signal transduction histidine kinase